jgi:hypothetical protein
MLSAKFIATAPKPNKEREFYWDERLPGFGLMITANGARSYVVQYRNADGVSRRIGIALETNRRFCKSVDPRSHRGESRWLFEHTL